MAELLANLVPCTDSLDVPTTWESLPFFEITKAMHNALQGTDVEISYGELQRYREALRDMTAQLRLDADVTIVHDPQPAYLIETPGVDRSRLVWRCHIDLSHPSQPVWRFLRRAVQKYAFAVFHIPQFAQRLAIPQLLMPPSIDPRSVKNRDLEDAEITGVTDRFGIDRRRPILLQVSRFDRFKDPLGVIEAHRMVRQSFDCQLVLAGGSASDDPEGVQVLSEVKEAAARAPHATHDSHTRSAATPPLRSPQRRCSRKKASRSSSSCSSSLPRPDASGARRRLPRLPDNRRSAQRGGQTAP